MFVDRIPALGFCDEEGVCAAPSGRLVLSRRSTDHMSLRGAEGACPREASGESNHIPRAPTEKYRIVGAACGVRRCCGARKRVVRESRRARAAAVAADIVSRASMMS